MGVRSRVRREPVVKAFVLAAVALATAFGYSVDNDVAESAIDIGSVAFAVYQMLKARSKVTPD